VIGVRRGCRHPSAWASGLAPRGLGVLLGLDDHQRTGLAEHEIRHGSLSNGRDAPSGFSLFVDTWARIIENAAIGQTPSMPPPRRHRNTAMSAVTHDELDRHAWAIALGNPMSRPKPG